ncbi:MAG TPA: hypothetical protein VMT54_16760 [Candidatus Cybelea sp.]|nr:hypothetical protein [Candidatus Cybelea sp.]
MLFALTPRMFLDQLPLAERLLRAASGFRHISLVVDQAVTANLDALLQRLDLAAEIEIIPAPADGELWGWAQDRFLVCCAGAETVVVGSASSAAGETPLCAASARGIAGHASVPLRFEGGNILADAETCFIGADLVTGDGFGRFAPHVESRRALRAIGCSRPLARRGPARFEIEPGDRRWRQDVDRCIARSGSRQPVFHIDMFMTLAGRNRVLLGDPVWASAVIGVKLPDGFPAFAFDEIAASLRDDGFEVIRNPLPFVYFDDPRAKLREWFYASANNCWVEWVEGERGRIWLPEYGFGAWPELKATDDLNAAIWCALGFDVIRTGDFLPLAADLGSLNCISKILARG